MTWKNGRRLATFTNDDVSASFDYDADGLRTTKTVGTSRVDYYRAGGLLLGEVHTNGSESYTINYMYDESRRMLGFRLDGAEYYYVRDYSGDVTGLINSRGELIGSYLYDPWGVLLETYLNTFEEETSEWTDADRAEYMRVLNLNPIRYKSYYYDTETGFYYLQSRYYDPITTRFINADGLISTGTGVLGYNMFAYCNNNPIMYSDSTGMYATTVLGDEIVLKTYGNGEWTKNPKKYNPLEKVEPARKPQPKPVFPIWPISDNEGYVTYPYIENDHNAVDIGYNLGTSINACMSGTITRVVMCYPNDFYSDYGEATYGNYIDILGDDGYTYRYAHLMQVDLFGEAGLSGSVRVSQGQKIGEMGCTGHTLHYDSASGTFVPGGGVHLHLEIFDNSGVRINPLSYIVGG